MVIYKKKLPRKGAITEKGRLRCLKIISHILWDPRVFSHRKQTAWLYEPGSSHIFFHKICEMGEEEVTRFLWDQSSSLLAWEEGEFTLREVSLR